MCVYLFIFFFEGQFLKIYCVIGGQWALQNFKLLPGTIFVTTTKYTFEQLTISLMIKKKHALVIVKAYLSLTLKQY